MASACALDIFSGKIIFYFGIAERLRTLRYSLFTEGVVKDNGIAPPPVKKFFRKVRRLFGKTNKKFSFRYLCPEQSGGHSKSSLYAKRLPHAMCSSLLFVYPVIPSGITPR